MQFASFLSPERKGCRLRCLRAGKIVPALAVGPGVLERSRMWTSPGGGPPPPRQRRCFLRQLLFLLGPFTFLSTALSPPLPQNQTLQKALVRLAPLCLAWMLEFKVTAREHSCTCKRPRLRSLPGGLRGSEHSIPGSVDQILTNCAAKPVVTG